MCVRVVGHRSRGEGGPLCVREAVCSLALAVVLEAQSMSTHRLPPSWWAEEEPEGVDWTASFLGKSNPMSP
ncbi:MAG: hypothetical protein BWY17_03670 [Deltaproteobacteria bacterium ADurb.Bin207]|nr:MAG: hypothetical protein BWY17_03670 [Deltaproteobacteria bacterium ADurb.Bin207]